MGQALDRICLGRRVQCACLCTWGVHDGMGGSTFSSWFKMDLGWLTCSALPGCRPSILSMLKRVIAPPKRLAEESLAGSWWKFFMGPSSSPSALKGRPSIVVDGGTAREVHLIESGTHVLLCWYQPWGLNHKVIALRCAAKADDALIASDRLRSHSCSQIYSQICHLPFPRSQKLQLNPIHSSIQCPIRLILGLNWEWGRADKIFILK